MISAVALFMHGFFIKKSQMRRSKKIQEDPRENLGAKKLDLDEKWVVTWLVGASIIIFIWVILET